MIKKIVEFPFRMAGWLFKDTYGRVASVLLLTVLVCLVNYPMQDTKVGVWEVEDTLKEEFSKAESQAAAGKGAPSDVQTGAGIIDRTAIESRTVLSREVEEPWAFYTLPFHPVVEREDEVIEETWDPSRKNKIKHRRITRISKGLTLGLDLRGGIELVYKVVKPEDEETTPLKAQDIAEVIRRRIDAYGMREPRVQPMGDDRILIQIPGSDASDVARVRNVITRVGRLEFRLVADEANNKTTLEDARNRPKDDPPPGWHWYTLSKENRKTGKMEPEDLLINDDIGLTGEAIERVGIGRDRETGKPTVTLTFKDREAFWKLTKANVDRRLAILLDDVRSKDGKTLFKTGRVHSAPSITKGIYGPGEIRGGFTLKSAEDLKYVLQSGSLKWPLEMESERSVGPYQGVKAIREGQQAIVIGFLAVVLFILVYYLKAGVVADFALLLNLLTLVAALSLRNATLTLPGIAGIMLTIGMSIDANVLIFERVREELKKMTDKPLLKCLRDGHRKALVTIVDANLTTLITAMILHLFGTGPVKGFATTLSYGIVISMFTAVVVTRIVFEALIKAGLVKKLRMFEMLKRPNIPFIAMRKAWLAASMVLVIAGLVYFFTGPGRRLGIEFSSGTRVEVNLKKKVESAEFVREIINQAGYEDVEVQEIGRVAGAGASTFAIRIGYTPVARILSSGPVDAAAHPDLANGAEVVVETDRAVNPARMAGRLARVKSKNCVVEEVAGKEGLYTYAVRNPDRTVESADTLESNVRAVFGDERIKGDIRDQFETAGDLLAEEGIRELSEPGAPKLEILVALTKPTSPDHLEKTLTPVHATVEAVEALEDGKAATFKVAADGGSLPRIKQLIKEAKYEDDRTKMATLEPFASVQKIYPSVARELGVRAATALFLALLAIVAYIWFRFEFRFGLAAVAALVHDVAITLGALALFQYEISLTVIAALLTIIGYSLNDTIVVFDRIRENRRTVRKTPFPDIVNLSINQTLGRTILTSLTTLLAVLSLFLFGGAAIEAFAFTLLVGVIVGTYSSVFIASPVLLMTGEQGALRGPLSASSARIARPLEGLRTPR